MPTATNKIAIIQVIKGVLAALIGVNSQENMERDFQQASVISYLVVGIITVVIIALIFYAIVSN